MNLAHNHLKRFPNARPTTISDKLKVEATTEQLRAEVEALHRANEFRSRVRHQPLAGLLMKAKRLFGEMFGGWVV